MVRRMTSLALAPPRRLGWVWCGLTGLFGVAGIVGCTGSQPPPVAPRQANVDLLIHDIENRSWDAP
jgi:hypothetical protein